MIARLTIEYEIQTKKFWRCHVCNDLHYGDRAPAICPTCGAKNAFVQVDLNEATNLIGGHGGFLSSVDEVKATWAEFGKVGVEYKLSEDLEMVNGLAEGVLENQRSHGLKYCPCRLTKGDAIEDLKLVCPCNFQIQKTYQERGECWCGLFVKR